MQLEISPIPSVYKHEVGLGHWTGWLGSPVVMALDLRLDGREFDSRPPRLVLGWVTLFGRANHRSISPSHPMLTQPPTLSGTGNTRKYDMMDYINVRPKADV